MAWYSYIPGVGPMIDGAVASGQGVDYSALDAERRAAAAMGQGFAADRAAVGPVDRTMMDGYRQREGAALGMLEQQVQQQQQGPSTANLAYRGAVGDIAAQQMAYAGQQGGTAGVAARRDAVGAIADQRRKAAIDMAMLRAKENADFQQQKLGATAALTDRFAANRRDEGNFALQGRQIIGQERGQLAQQMLQAGAQSQDMAATRFGGAEAARQEKMKRFDNYAQSGAKAFGAM